MDLHVDASADSPIVSDDDRGSSAWVAGLINWWPTLSLRPSTCSGRRAANISCTSEDHGDVYIKSGSATGSNDLALGTQQVKVGTCIPIHRHLKMEERFYVLEGSGRVILADVPQIFEKGTTIIIPKNTWHGFENPDHELLLLWIGAPAGLDGFFRETCTPPGASPKSLSREQLREIARRYDTEFR